MQMSQLTKRKLKSAKTVNLKKAKRKNLILGSLIAITLILTPYFFYLYQGIPDQEVWDSPFGEITSNYYGSVQIMFWVLFGKIIPLVLLLIWFFTCKHWWYHAILVPILMFIFQAYSTLNDDIEFSDSNEFFVLAPIIFVMLIFSYTVRTRVFDKVHGIDLSELNRVNWKGEIVKEDTFNEPDGEDDDDDEPAFMA